MLLSSNEKNKILYKQAEKKKYNEKVDKLKENYSKFEKGEIKEDQLKETIYNVKFSNSRNSK
jgi:hypothetical protein